MTLSGRWHDSHTGVYADSIDQFSGDWIILTKFDSAVMNEIWDAEYLCPIFLLF